jgi:hypothetical protein
MLPSAPGPDSVNGRGFAMIRSLVVSLRRTAPTACAALLLLCAACPGGGTKESPPPAAKAFPVPLFDGLWLGMPRDEVARAHSIRPALTPAGKTRLVWVYDRPGEYAVDLTFKENRPDARLQRIDVHFGTNDASSRRTIGALAQTLGEPDVKRSKAATNAYGDRFHDQYDTVWSDASQYVFVTERVPLDGRPGPSVFYITVKKKELVPKGPPTGYVPPPPPKGKDGKPVEEPIF